MAKRRKQQETTGYIILAIFGGILLWLLSKGQSILHESVTTKFISPDPATGAPQFDATNVPPGEEFAIAPICGPGPATFNPANPKACTCPAGYTLWKNSRAGTYECIPNTVG